MRKVALLMTVLLVLTAGSAYASPGEMDSPLLTTYDLIAAADKQLGDAKSFEIDMKFVFDMGSEGESFGFDLDINGKVILEPLTVKLDVSADTGTTLGTTLGMSNNYQTYVRKEGAELVTYTSRDGKVYKSSMTDTAGELLDMQTVLSEIGLDAKASPLDYDKLAYIGETKLNGKDVYVVEAKPKARVEKMLYLAAFMGMFDEYNEKTFDTVVSAAQSVSYMCYVDKKTHQYVRIEVDMTGMINQIIADFGMEQEGVDMNKFAVVLDLKNIDNVKPFDVPKSVVSKARETLSPEVIDLTESEFAALND